MRPFARRPPALDGSYLVVELTNRCSLLCVHCSVSEVGHAHHQRTGYLDPALFDGLMADLSAVGARFDALILFWLGEPLLHPHFTRIYRRAVRDSVQHGTFGKVEVHSNATHLTPARVAAALNEAPLPQVWHLSLDAATVETYRAVKGLDRFAQVDAQVEHLLRERARLRAPWPRPVLQFIVGDNNVQDVDRFIDRWSGLLRSIGSPFRLAAGHVPPGEDAVLFLRQRDSATPEAQDRDNALLREAARRLGLSLPSAEAAVSTGATVQAHNLRPCSGFWKSPVISWRGELTACTRDNLLHNTVGSLRERPFSTMWWGEAMRAHRAAVAGGDYGALPLCQTCFIPTSLNHTELSAEDIVKQANFDDALSAEAAP
jgi:MoaA/NifB/PqqE/SkfB family radical SAM enzyme